jgi:hypothetical protein
MGIWLVHNAASISAVATVVYAIFTAWLIIEMRASRRVQTTPYLAAFAEERLDKSEVYDFVIANDGPGAALTIRVELDNDPEVPGGWHLSDQGRIKDGIEYLGPGKQVRVLLYAGVFDLNNTQYKPTTGTLRYMDIDGHKKATKFRVNLREVAVYRDVK